MAAKEEKEIIKHLKIALEEIGEITPRFSKKFDAWIFSHQLYPVEYAGETKEDVIKNYPLYLKEFIKHRLQDRLSPLMENKTKGHGGKRIGAGRPQGSKQEEKVRIYVPKDIASWLRYPETIAHIRSLIHAFPH
ncbi:MAG: hypothetical protein LLF94_03295 [Chlamydiales bacterium]|nr:hypothetical protein [Chlamydiales bacterium]